MASEAEAKRGLGVADVAPLGIFGLISIGFFVGLFWGTGRDIPSALIGAPAPEMALAPLLEDGVGLTTAELQAPGMKIVNVWASWCGPCRAEHPVLMRLQRQSDAPIYGLNYKDRVANARAFLEELGDPFAGVGVDGDGTAGIEWGVYGVPETFVVDGEGRIVEKHVGPMTFQILNQKILPALTRPPDGE